MANLQKVYIGAVRRCDGMGEPASNGDYVLLHIEVETERPRLLRMSTGAAALLVAELSGCGVEHFTTSERYVPTYKPSPNLTRALDPREDAPEA